MKNFCGECGFRLDQEFKFCPNCGNELASGSNSDKITIISKSEKYIVCENCGEDNLATNVDCSGCGAKLKGSIVEGGVAKIGNQKKTKTRQRKNKKVAKEKVLAKQEKTLNNKKILFISSFVIAIIVVLLVVTGVIDSGINQSQQLTSNDEGSGVNLSNLNEITELENTVKANPDDITSMIKLANLLQDSGLYDRAIVYYKKYLEKNPSDSNARVDMGICFYNVNDLGSAIAEMETALQYQPNHQLGHLNLGIVNLTAGNVDVSKEWFRKTIEIDPNSQAGIRAQELLQSH